MKKVGGEIVLPVVKEKKIGVIQPEKIKKSDKEKVVEKEIKEKEE